jgi:hypothetical protein
MADLTPTAQWVGTYQIETTDLVQGGAGGIANDPHQDLLDRTEYLYDAVIAAGTDLATPVDIKFTGNTNTNLFYADVSQDNIGIGKTPVSGYMVEINNKVATSSNLRLAASNGTPTEGANIVFADKSNADAYEISVNATGIFRMTAAGNTFFSFNPSEIVINESGIDRNFRVEGDTDINLIFCDAGQDNIGIGTATPLSTVKLDVVSTTAYAIFGDTDSTSGGAAVRADATGTGASSTRALEGNADGNTGIGISATATATGAFINYGGRFQANGDSGIGVDSSVAGATATAIKGVASSSTGVNFGGDFTCASNSTSAAAVRGAGDGSNSYDFIAVNSRVSGFSGRQYKIAKRNVNILQKIRDYDDWSIHQWSYKYNENFDDMILPYSDDFNRAFGYNPENDDMINTSNLSGIAFGGVVQLIEEFDKLKEKVKQLEENK